MYRLLVLAMWNLIFTVLHVFTFSRCDMDEEPEDEDELMLRATYKKMNKVFKKPGNKKEEQMERVSVWASGHIIVL